MVSDVVCGEVQSSEEQLDHSPMSHPMSHDHIREEEEEEMDSLFGTPNTVLGVEGHVFPAAFEGRSEGRGRDEEDARKLSKKGHSALELHEGEGEEDDARKLLKQGDSTVSALVLHKGEKWSKEKLRMWVNQSKRKKLAEFVEMRGTKSRLISSPTGPVSKVG